MIFQTLSLPGAFLITPEAVVDERGFFARSFCKDEFEKNGLETKYVQHNISYNKQQGTLRGLHYQAFPCEEVKVVRCTRGAVFDVIVDLRKDSPMFKKWLGFELSEKNSLSLYIPVGFAHGFLTCTEDSELHYQMSASYHPEHSRTIHWKTSEIGVEWPFEPQVISENDRNANTSVE